MIYASGIFPPVGQPRGDALWLHGSADKLVYGILGHYIAARLAPDRSMFYALALGAIGSVPSTVGVVATWNGGSAFGPKCHSLGLVAIALPFARVGGKLSGGKGSSLLCTAPLRRPRHEALEAVVREGFQRLDYRSVEVHLLIHRQLRFLHLEFLFNQVMSFRVEDILKTPVAFLPHIMREFDRLPARIQRTIKAIRAEQKVRFDLLHDNENLEIEAIPDQPPPRPKQEFYDGVLTPQCIVALDKFQKTAKTNPPPQKPPTALDAELLFRNFAERMQTKYGTYAEQLAAAQKLAEETEKAKNEPNAK